MYFAYFRMRCDCMSQGEQSSRQKSCKGMPAHEPGAAKLQDLTLAKLPNPPAPPQPHDLQDRQMQRLRVKDFHRAREWEG